MAYKGATYRIPCTSGGNFYAPNLDSVPPEAMIDPTKNINMNTGGRTKRGGTAHAEDAALTGEPQILNGYDFHKKDGTQWVVRNETNGNLYKNNTTTIQTGMATSGRPCYETFLDTLYVTDGVSKPQTWNGVAASTSDLSTPPADWTGAHQPKYCLKHGVGAAQRMWYHGLDNHLDRLYYSILGNGQDLTAAGAGQFTIETSDGFGIRGSTEFGARLISFGKRKAYLVDDGDPSPANWGIIPAQWEGGVAHHNLLVKTPNDLVAMMEDGEIYSVSAAQTYGDYKTASLTRPSFVHSWIKDNLDLAEIDSFHAVYDRVLRAIKFFVRRYAQSGVDTALVYFIDRAPTEAWQIHDNQDNDSGYDASCAFEVRESTGVYTIFTGDYSGWLWKTEQDEKNDNDEDFTCQFKTPPLAFDNPRVNKKYRRGKIIFASPGNYNVNVRWWVDSVEQTPRVVTLASTGGIYGSAEYDSSTYAGPALDEADFELGAIGKRFQIQLENSTADEDFFISQILIDNEILGARAS